MRAKHIRARVVWCLLACSCLLGSGCVGYLTGMHDAEVLRLQNIVAELEARNAALAEECIGLRKRIRELEPEAASHAEDADTATGTMGSGAGGPDT